MSAFWPALLGGFLGATLGLTVIIYLADLMDAFRRGRHSARVRRGGLKP
ncbi:MAG: hypothetical protein H0U69_03660 [Trueperaceae bacterium]|nr:hypothetical protein [Trueperaceae bacterium]